MTPKEYSSYRERKRQVLRGVGFDLASEERPAFPPEMAYSLTCGAAVALLPSEEGVTAPLDLHATWHQQT
ncbi:MAG TPA: hypothetical protein VER39_02375 [Nocardioidaceae bacterium]|nr:hypothetical protein [Nocardioidaceae bacterium]